MNIIKTAIFCSVTSLMLMTACATTESRKQTVRTAPTDMRNDTRNDTRNETRMGKVSNIEIVAVSARTSGGGAVLGAIIGGALGNQVGKGDGRTAATVVGAVGGAVAGNAIERRTRREDEFYRVSVRFDNGSVGQFDYQNIYDLRIGDRVKVMNGEINRM